MGPKRVIKSRAARWTAVALVGTAAATAGYLRLSTRSGSTNDARAPTPQAARIARPEPRPGGYVGSAACAECHAGISERYATHPMSRSLASVARAEPVEDFDHPAFESGGRNYRVERTADAVLHHEAMTGTDGQPLYDQAVEVAYALGSGKRGRGYVLDRGERLFLSPVSWYSGRGRWDLSPGYDRDAIYRFERPATEACLTCHSGRLNLAAPGTDHFRDPPFHEVSIGCERCHGPGKEHVERHRSGDLARPDPIVDPADLDPDRREAVCQQCHLLGTERILRYGRSESDFRPGDRLEDVWTVFVGGTGLAADGTTEAVSHVEQMRSSRCYLGSGGRLGCVSCHDPHSAPAPQENDAFFNARCSTCHGDAAPDPAGANCSLPLEDRMRPPAEGSCIRCHMPRLDANDVPHTSQSDHRILRRPTSQDANVSPREETPTLFDGAADRLPPLVAARAEGLRLIRSTNGANDIETARRAETLLKPSLAAAPDDAEVLEALGDAAELDSRIAEAIRYWERAMTAAPRRESTLVRLAVAHQSGGRAQECLAVLDRLIAVNPWIAEYHGRRAFVLAQLGRLQQASASADRALELNPSIRQTYRSAAEVRRLLGDEAGARHYLDLFSRFPPE